MIVRADDVGLASSVSNIPSNNVWMFENGTLATGQIGYFNSDTDSWHIKTEDKTYISGLRTIVRGCSSSNRLVDIFFQTEVKKNTKPKFSPANFKKTITLEGWEDHQEIFLPDIIDDEGQDYDIYITRTEGKSFPPFLFFDKYTKKISLKPDDAKYQGRTSYFNLVLKERGTTMEELSETMFCTVNVEGALVPEEERFNFTDIKFKMSDITNHSSGMITFS